MRQKFRRAIVLREKLFLPAETRRMGLPAAMRKPDRVFDMEHFVVKDVGHNIFRDTRVVELAIHYNLVQGRIKATQLCSPYTAAPGKAGRHYDTIEILAVEAIKQQL
jgi:hypothetical protein